LNNKDFIYIHPSSIVDEGVNIGKGSKIWHWVHICKGAKIGECCTLGQNVFIAGKAKLGNNVKVQNNVSIFDNVEIGDNVFCGPSVVFTNVYNPRSEINRKNEYKRTIISDGSTLGANSTIICGIEIGEYAFIGAGSLVNKNVKPYALMVGVPAKQIGWMSAYGERINIPLKGNDKYLCPHTGDNYTLNDNFLVRYKSNK
tara:strand:+ start:5100 stop:5699 length:600 start_codon:yes stop_codon:yes gene_type:complete